MAKLLNCRHLDLECDFLCAESEDELFKMASQYSKGDLGLSEIQSEFEDRVRLVMQEVEHC